MANIKLFAVINDTLEDIYFHNKETSSDSTIVKAGQIGFTLGRDDAGCDIPDCSDNRYYNEHHISIEKRKDRTVLYAVWKIDNQAYYSPGNYFRNPDNNSKIPGNSTFNDKQKVLWVKQNSIQIYDLDSPNIKIKNNFKSGHYETTMEIAGTVFHGHHAYVRVFPDNDEKKCVNFQCYGGITPDKGFPNYYPDVQSVGDLTLARTICCLDPDDTRRDYNRGKDEGGDFLFGGDCCGVTYGVGGVCHQMANRILFASLGTPVINVNGTIATYALYGHYGWGYYKMLSPFNIYRWDDYLSMCKAKLMYPNESICMETEALKQVKKDIHDRLLRNAEKVSLQDPVLASIIKFEVQNAGSEDIISKRMENLINAALGSNFAGLKKSNVINAHDEFVKFKDQYDMDLLQGKITADKYAAEVNEKFRTLHAKLYQELEEEDYRKLFREAYNDKFMLINPALLVKAQGNSK